MRAIAGTLRLDLAQYRELAAFAQFGSDLDKTTQSQLNRGRRLVEILKQNQYVPMDVALQIASVFAGTKGFLDDLRVEAVLLFETALHEYLGSQHAPLLKEIREAGSLRRRSKKRSRPRWARPRRSSCLPARGEAGLGRHGARDMANLIDIRRRIRSVKNTQQITKAVKMVAASKLRRSQDRAIASRPYATTLEAILRSVASRIPPREERRRSIRFSRRARRRTSFSSS